MAFSLYLKAKGKYTVTRSGISIVLRHRVNATLKDDMMRVFECRAHVVVDPSVNSGQCIENG